MSKYNLKKILRILKGNAKKSKLKFLLTETDISNFIKNNIKLSNELHETWVNNNYAKRHSPSIRLKDNTKDYTYDNLMLTTTIRHRQILLESKTKKCTSCTLVKDKSEFRSNVSNIDKLHRQCKKCEQEKRRTKHGLCLSIYHHQREHSIVRKHERPSYTKQELFDYLINSDVFNTLYVNWVKSDYDIKLTPSLDRLDNSKGYSFDNIQIITWEENNYLGTVSTYVPVRQLTLDGIYVKDWESISHVRKELGLNSSTHISSVCKGKRNYAYGFKWEYIKT